jgi:hypothetical protein
MHKILLSLLILQPHSLVNNKFYITLKYIAYPAHNIEWQIEVYRTKEDKIYIKNDNYLYKRYEKKFPVDYYRKLVFKLNKMGVWHAKGAYNRRFSRNYYLIEIKSSKYSNSFRIADNTEFYGNDLKYPEMIKLIKKYVKLTVPEN